MVGQGRVTGTSYPCSAATRGLTITWGIATATNTRAGLPYVDRAIATTTEPTASWSSLEWKRFILRRSASYCYSGPSCGPQATGRILRSGDALLASPFHYRRLNKQGSTRRTKGDKIVKISL